MSHLSERTKETGSAAWLPESARRILLVSGPAAADGWGGAAAIEVAEMVARVRPRTLLVNTVAGSAGPDSLLRTGGGPGLGDIVGGRNRVSEAAFTPPGRSFIALPAGDSTPGLVELCRRRAFRHLVEAAGRGGTLLVHASEADLAHLCREPAACEGLGFDGLVSLAGAAVPRNMLPGVQLLARVEPDAPRREQRGAAAVPTGRTSGFTRPASTPAIVASGRRKERRGRFERLVHDMRRLGVSRGVKGVAAVWLMAVIAVWLVWQGLSGWPAFEDSFESPPESTAVLQSSEPEGTPAEALVPAGADLSDPGGGAGGGRGAPPSSGEAGVGADSMVEPGADLPYSILVASVVTYDDAAAKREELAEGGELAFIAPTPVRDRLYYRVFAGALEDREQARSLMRQLVERGTKERERDWDMRPVRLAFLLGEYPSEEEANDERRRLHDSGVSAYVLAAGDSSGAMYRLYSGAFESEGAAGPADSILSVAGRAATLVTRRGEPR